MLHPSQERTKYHLVYLTSHHTGIVEFMEISEKVGIVQARVTVPPIGFNELSHDSS